jgi:hypothetical protein
LTIYLVGGLYVPFIAAVVMCLPQVLNRMHDALDASVKVRVFAKRWSQASKHKGRDHGTDLIVTGNCIRHPQSNKYLVAPAEDGRMTIINAVLSDDGE